MSMSLFAIYTICLLATFIGVSDAIGRVHKNYTNLLSKLDWSSVSRMFRYGIFAALIYFPHISIMLSLKESALLICAIYCLETLTFHALYRYVCLDNVNKNKKLLAYLWLGATIIIPYILYYVVR